MTITVAQITPLVALIAGILILLVPRLLNYIVAIYLIIVGITGFAQAGSRSDLLKGASSNPIEAVLPLRPRAERSFFFGLM
jgi:hypothetical protein